MTTYAKYYPQAYPTGNCFNTKEQKLIQSAQSGIGDEATLRLAIAESDAGALIVLAPTTITLTSQLVIDKPLVIRGTSAGARGTKITGTTSGALISIELTAFSSAANVEFHNLTIQHGTDDVDVVAINNTNASAALTVKFAGCNVRVFDSAANGFAIIASQATSGQAVSLHITGDRSNTVDALSMTMANASNRLLVQGVVMEKAGKTNAATTSSGAVAAQIRLVSVQLPHDSGLGGGNAAQLVIAERCTSVTGTTYAAVDTNDLIGSQTETIV